MPFSAAAPRSLLPSAPAAYLGLAPSERSSGATGLLPWRHCVSVGPADGSHLAAASASAKELPAVLSSGLVKGVFPFEGLGFIGGQSGAGKSAIMVELTICFARQIPFFDKKVRERVGSAIIAAEGAGGIQNRITAAKIKYNIEDTLPIRCIPFSGNLCAGADLQQVAATLRKTNEDFLSVHGVRLGAVFVDTLTAACLIDDENDAAKATQAMNILKWLGKEASALVLPLHHYGKAATTGLRGSSAYRGGADVVLSVLCDRDEINR
jgi:RecA-family ATPase